MENNGFLPTRGGGFRDMFVEGFGIPQGHGYYGLVENMGTPSGYVGPTYGVFFGLYRIPAAAAGVEIDAGALMRIDNVHIADGGVGPGNSAFQCGLDESDPTGSIVGAVASIDFTNSRLDANPAFSAGPSNPDIALRLGNSCSGSTFRNLKAYDGMKADVLAYNANILSQVQIDSGATSASTANGPAPTINWGAASLTNFGLAGVADYGVYVLGATTMAQTVCGIANVACVLTIPNISGSLNAGQITDTQMRCGGFSNVPTGYVGVELGAGVRNAAVSGTASAGKCAVPAIQLVRLDDAANATSSGSLSLCNNTNALVAGCSGYQGPFASGQFYTQPVVNYGAAAMVGNRLYASPFYSPAGGGAITKLGINVTGTGTATQCEVGVYNAFNGRPNALIADGGAVTISGAGTLVTSGTFSATVQLAPQTLYYLAVGCNGSLTLQGNLSSGSNVGLGTPLTGAPGFVVTSSQIYTAWSFAANALPNPFGTVTATSGAVPNVYAGP